MRLLLGMAIALTGCGGSSADKLDAVSAAECSADCMSGWWATKTGGCSAVCILSPKPRECSTTDCEQVMVYDFASATYNGSTAVHSPSRRMFTLLTKSPGTWSLPSACYLSLNPQTDPEGKPFTCTANAVTTLARTWNRPEPTLEAALSGTEAGTLPATGSY